MASLAETKKIFDKVFSIYIRKRDRGICFTCGANLGWRKIQNGHFVSRTFMSTRYDETNTAGQCKPCNIFHHGNMVEYAVRLQRKYGIGILEELWLKKHTTKKWTVPEMLEKIEYYKKEIEKLNKKYKYTD